MSDTLINSFTVAYHYPVCWGHNIFKGRDRTLETFLSDPAFELRPTPVLVFMDAGFAAAWPEMAQDIVAWGETHPELISLRIEPQVLPGGEACKNGLAVPQKVIATVQKARLCRHSQIWVIGGGAFLDAVGLGAALFHRGIPLLRFPTTSLAQCDSGVGVKNGCNLKGIKNLVGVFAPPIGVMNDPTFLVTLPQRDWLSGIAEAFKVAIIQDLDFLQWLANHASELRERNFAAMEILLKRCAALHVQHIQKGGDPFELGSARPLDFGHWSAHKLESLSHFSIKHGEAVSIGIALDLHYAAAIKLISKQDAQFCCQALQNCGLPICHPLLQKKNRQGKLQLLDGLDEFREHLGGTLHLTLPAPLGQKIEVSEMNTQILIQSLQNEAWAKPENGR
ncbi:MAG: 3-dehydroquinate synthase [Lentisphaeria bacterium]